MDLEAEISVQLPHSPYLHDSSKIKLLSSGTNGTPVTAVEEAAAAVVAASRAGYVDATTTTPPPGLPGLPAPLLPSTTAPVTTTTNGKDVAAGNKKVRYRECQKNHAAGIGGHALDGCGEFMPSGEEGSVEALKCSACDCHRNFHRREVEGEVVSSQQQQQLLLQLSAAATASKDAKRKAGVPLQHTSPLAAITPTAAGRSTGGTLMALSNSDQSDEQDGGVQQQHHHGYSLAHHLIPSAIRKRFRTKFTGEQKEKMYQFADRLGWKIQKHDEADVQQFCAEVGVKRHVLKVWMHNNKNTYGKKIG